MTVAFNQLALRIAHDDIPVLRSHPYLASVSCGTEPRDVIRIHFDTPDGTLRRRGLTLAICTSDGASIQSIRAARNDGVGQPMWTKTVTDARPDFSGAADSPIGEGLTDELCASLVPQCETRIARTTYRVKGSSAEIAVAVDDGQHVADGTEQRACRVTLDLVHGSPLDLFKVARAVSGIVPALPDRLHPDGHERTRMAACKASLPPLNADMDCRSAFASLGRACVHQITACAPAVHPRNPAALHQIRVALRRLRAAMALFSSVVTDDRAESLKAELRWLGRELGPARDLDTFLAESLRPLHKRHVDEPAFASLVRVFERDRRKSYRRVEDAIESARFRALVLDALEWIETGPWAVDDDSAAAARRDIPIGPFAAAVLSRQRKRIRRVGGEMASLQPNQLHRLRIRIKKARYAAEFFGGVYPGKKAARRHAAWLHPLEQLQDCLGAINDIATRKRLCEDILARPGRGLSPDKARQRAFASGLVLGDQQSQLPHLIGRAGKAYMRWDAAKAFWK